MRAMERTQEQVASMRAAWRSPPPGRLIGKGHPAGDFLQAYDWELEQEERGALTLLVTLPDHVRNPRGQLFGGFTPTYVDLVALLTLRAGTDRSKVGWLATTSMNVDYLAPIWGPQFRIRSHVASTRKRSHLVECRFFDVDNHLCVLAITKMLAVKAQGKLGDG